MKPRFVSLTLPTLLAVVLAGWHSTASAVEGGLGAYQLGSRGPLAGFVPPPGDYFNVDLIFISGEVDQLPIGGVALDDVDVDAFVVKPNVTHVFAGQIWGGSPAINVQLPVVTADITFSDILGTPISGSLEDEETGFGDPVVTPMVGWHHGNWHYSTGASIFIPLGKYDIATVDVAAREIDVLSTGKNKFAVQPFVNATYLNPQTGREASASMSVTFNEENDDTDYKNGDEFIFEGALGQHLPNGLTLGLVGYYYNQLSNDSGAGAESFQQTVGARSLKARVTGLGPYASYNTKLGGYSASFAARYYTEFNAKRRFESDVLWLTAGLVF